MSAHTLNYSEEIGDDVDSVQCDCLSVVGATISLVLY